MQEGQPEAEQQTELAARASTQDGKHSHPELIIDTGITTSVTVGRRPMCEVAATFTALLQMVHSSDSVQSEIGSDGKRRWIWDDMESRRCHRMIWIWTDSAGSPPSVSLAARR